MFSWILKSKFHNWKSKIKLKMNKNSGAAAYKIQCQKWKNKKY